MNILVTGDNRITGRNMALNLAKSFCFEYPANVLEAMKSDKSAGVDFKCLIYKTIK